MEVCQISPTSVAGFQVSLTGRFWVSAKTESEAQWEAFLNDLYRRGIEGKTLELITTDGCPGLQETLDMVYPYVPIQQCWAHKLRNMAAKTKRVIKSSVFKVPGVSIWLRPGEKQQSDSRYGLESGKSPNRRRWIALKKTWMNCLPSWTAPGMHGVRYALLILFNEHSRKYDTVPD